jgi:hypothetical protein
MRNTVEISLRDGTMVRHRQKGYQGQIEGTTSIKSCFTKGGELLNVPMTKEAFQYRVVVSGRSMRYIAPLEDLEILDAAEEILCVRCQHNFYSKPAAAGKAGGRCACGGWICPACLGCQVDGAVAAKATPCPDQRKRFLKSRRGPQSKGSHRTKSTDRA